MILFLCVILVIFIIGICFRFYTKKKEKNDKEIAETKIKARNSMLEKLRDNNFTIDKEVSYHNIGICVDNKNKQWCVYNLSKSELTIYDYTCLLDFKVKCERLREKEEYSTNIPNKYFINAYISVNDISNPSITLSLGGGEGRPSTNQMQRVSEFESILTFIKENSKKLL